MLIAAWKLETLHRYGFAVESIVGDSQAEFPGGDAAFLADFLEALSTREVSDDLFGFFDLGQE